MKLIKEYAQLVEKAKTGQEIKIALCEGFEDIDKVVRVLLTIQTIQGVVLIILAVIALKQ